MQMPSLSSDAHVIQGIFYKYLFVGSGAQFRVYAVYTHDDRPTRRVVKVPLDFDETRKAISEPLRRLAVHDSEEMFDELADKRTYEVLRFKYDVPRLIEGILGEDKIFRRKIGNLKMLQMPIPSSKPDNGAYHLPTLFTQDFVMTLDEYLQQFRLATNPYMRTLELEAIRQLEEVVDQVISLNFTIWEYGIFEFVFKPENFGIRFSANGKAELIWIDLAEHITDLDEATSILKERRWQHAVLPHKVDYQFMPTIIQNYFIEACDKSLTVENLNKYWRRKTNRIEKARSRKLRMREIVTQDSKKAVGLWIARHNLSQSLYQGFLPHTIDDLAMPLSDVEQLVSDREYLTAGRVIPIEEKVERHTAELGGTDLRVFPVIRSTFSQEGKTL
jgi:hypothetical protein